MARRRTGVLSSYERPLTDGMSRHEAASFLADLEQEISSVSAANELEELRRSVRALSDRVDAIRQVSQAQSEPRLNISDALLGDTRDNQYLVVGKELDGAHVVRGDFAEGSVTPGMLLNVTGGVAVLADNRDRDTYATHVAVGTSDSKGEVLACCGAGYGVCQVYGWTVSSDDNQIYLGQDGYGVIDKGVISADDGSVNSGVEIIQIIGRDLTGDLGYDTGVVHVGCDFSFDDPYHSPYDHYEVCIPVTLERNIRNQDLNYHGALDLLTSGVALDSSNPINVTKGSGKIYIVANAGTGYGTGLTYAVTITGTSRDRNTQATTPGDTETVYIEMLSSDTSSTDAVGNAVHAISKGVLSSKWWEGSVTISTTNVVLTDVDVYHVSFEQMRDAKYFEVDTFDMNVKTTNANAWIYNYLYVIQKTKDGTNTADISMLSSLVVTAAEAVANRYHRRKHSLTSGNWFSGSTDGIWIECNFGPVGTTYIEDMTLKVWVEVSEDRY